MMLLRFILNRVQSVAQAARRVIGAVVARWGKPVAPSPVLGTSTDLVRRKPHLVAENLLLRRQLIVLNCSVKRPRFTRADRALFVLRASRVHAWKEALLIVKPETVLRWHRLGFQLFWKRKSRATSREPKLPLETITLIKEMTSNNRFTRS